jgi:hypothetical protein
MHMPSDPLTCVFNRYSIHSQADAEPDCSRVTGHILSVGIIALVHLDSALKSFTNIAMQIFRTNDALKLALSSGENIPIQMQEQHPDMPT